MAAAGKLIILSAPSGSGKTTIAKHLLQNCPNLGFSVSATTRNRRTGEVNGKDYHFLSVEDFRKKIETGAFAEWEEVYPGTYYGTLISEMERLWAAGNAVLFDVDVQGGINLRHKYGDKALALFIRTPNFEVLEQRLRSRGSENEESLAKRLAKAHHEITFEKEFDYSLINDGLAAACSEAEKTVNDFLKS